MPAPRKRFICERSHAIAAHDIPTDSGLEQLGRLLDPAAMTPLLARRLPAGRSIVGVQILYLRYKPRTRLVVRYGVSLEDGIYDAHALAEPKAPLERWASEPEYVALAHMVNGRSPAREPLAYEAEVDALIQWLPLDLSMPALAKPPEELRRLLRSEGVDVAESGDPPRLLAFKARRRVVLQLDRHVVKIYAGHADFEGAAQGLRASERVHRLVVPAPEAVIPGLQLTCQGLLDGHPPGGPQGQEEIAGAVLASLHRSELEGLRDFPPAEQLKAAAASARSAAAVVPRLAQRIDSLVRRLELECPVDAELLPAHGDFHGKQLIELPEGLALIDFDEMCAAPAALDFSSYAAHLLTGGSGELEPAAAALDRLVRGYGGRPAALGWYTATSIVRRAPFPFRFMDDGWPQRIEQLLVDAEEALKL